MVHIGNVYTVTIVPVNTETNIAQKASSAIPCFTGLYGARIVTYFSTFKLWFSLRAPASAVAPESSILFHSRLWQRVLQNQ